MPEAVTTTTQPPTNSAPQQPQQEAALPSPTAPEEALPAGKKKAPMLIILLIVALVAAAIYYFLGYGNRADTLTTPTTQTKEASPAAEGGVEDDVTKSLEEVSTSDKLADIEEDLLGTDLNEIDSLFSDIEAELSE